MKRLLWQLFTTSFTWHFVVPLLVTGLLSTGLGFAHGARTPAALADYWLKGPIWEVLAIYVTFAIVLGYGIKQHTEARIANIAVLKDALPGCTSYFALAAIPLHEWFEPSVQVYLATLLGHQMATRNFHHERVLIFFDDPTLDDVHLSFSDEYYARCLNAIHREFTVPLAFLRASELFDILDDLDIPDRDFLGWSPRRSTLISRWRKKPRYSSKNPRTLAFAVLSEGSRVRSVILFSKGSRVLVVSQLKDASKIKPYVALAERVRQTIYAQGSTSVSRDHDFNEHIAL